MEVIDHGTTELPNVQGNDSIPTKYMLHRQSYTLYASVDTTSIPPSVIFEIDSKEIENPELGGLHLVCYGAFSPIRQREAEKRGIRDNSLRFTWLPTRHPECDEVSEPVGHDRKLVIQISDRLDDNIHFVEELLFEVKSNGIYREYDTL